MVANATFSEKKHNKKETFKVCKINVSKSFLRIFFLQNGDKPDFRFEMAAADFRRWIGNWMSSDTWTKNCWIELTIFR